MGQVLKEPKVVKTRTTHHCTWCDEIIEEGSEVESWVWKDEGDISRLYIHPECRDAQERADVWEWYEPRRRGMTMEELQAEETQ